MFTRADPYFSSLEENMDPEEIGSRRLSEMSKIMIDITSTNLDETLDYDNYKDYIHITAKNVIVTY